MCKEINTKLKAKKSEFLHQKVKAKLYKFTVCYVINSFYFY